MGKVQQNPIPKQEIPTEFLPELSGLGDSRERGGSGEV